MVKLPESESERGYWELLHESPESESIKKSLDTCFSNLFEGGHALSIRFLAKAWADELKEGSVSFSGLFKDIPQIHPRALDLLVQYGLDYDPLVWVKPPSWEPKRGSCFRNAYVFMQGSFPEFESSVYVEGLVIGAATRPMLHAWNASSLVSTRSLDWSHYSTTQWTRYLGIPFTSVEYEEIWETIFPDKKTIGGFFDSRHFPVVEKRLIDLLLKR